MPTLRSTGNFFYARNKRAVDALTGKSKTAGVEALVTIPESTLDHMNHAHELNALTTDKLIAANNSQVTMFTAALKDLNSQNIDARME